MVTFLGGVETAIQSWFLSLGVGWGVGSVQMAPSGTCCCFLKKCQGAVIQGKREDEEEKARANFRPRREL